MVSHDSLAGGPATSRYIPSKFQYQDASPPKAIVPELPQVLVDEFKKVPENYNMIPVLHNKDNFEQMQLLWKKHGILYARDIIANSASEIDYNMRICEN